MGKVEAEETTVHLEDGSVLHGRRRYFVVSMGAMLDSHGAPEPWAWTRDGEPISAADAERLIAELDEP